MSDWSATCAFLTLTPSLRSSQSGDKENDGGNVLPIFEEEGGSGGGIGLGYAKWAGKHYNVMKQVSPRCCSFRFCGVDRPKTNDEPPSTHTGSPKRGDDRIVNMRQSSFS